MSVWGLVMAAITGHFDGKVIVPDEPLNLPPNQRWSSIRLIFPLNLGDCFAYALAVAQDSPILTLDADFRAVDRPVIRP